MLTKDLDVIGHVTLFKPNLGTVFLKQCVEFVFLHMRFGFKRVITTSREFVGVTVLVSSLSFVCFF